MPTAMRDFNPSRLSDDQLQLCLDEMRKRGAAIGYYDAPAIFAIVSDWDADVILDDVQQWFDPKSLENAMAEAMTYEVDGMIADLEAKDDDYEDDDPEHDNDGDLLTRVDQTA